MKTIFICIVILSSTKIIYSQTPTSIMYSSGKAEEMKKAAGISGFNPWLGAQLSYNFEGTDEFSDNLLVAAKMVYEIKNNSSKFEIPIMGNFSDLKSELLENEGQIQETVKDIVISDQGFNVGLYPYYIINEYLDDDFYLVAHGSAGWKLNGFQKEENNVNYLNTGRFSIGLELGYGLMNTENGLRPFTLSLTPVVSVFDAKEYEIIFGESKSSILSFEATTILPIKDTGIGIMMEYVMSNDINNSFRAGILLLGKPL